MKNLVYITFLLISISFQGQDKTCSDFKTGKFKYANPKYAEWEVTRNDSIQIETSTKTGIKIYNTIVWNSDCNYVLTPRKVKNAKAKNYVDKVFYVQIIKTLNDRYFCILKNDAIEDIQLEMITVE